MRAVTIVEPGGPQVLRLAEVPDPHPARGEVLVKVAATAVNRADLLQRAGQYPPPTGASPYPGLECSGRIVALGEGTSDSDNGHDHGWSVGDEVCALLAGGGYAELVAVPVGQLLPIPAGVSLVDAAALPEAACTVWSNVGDLGGLRAGESLLVHGGSSGIGTFAVQFGVALGASVTATARRAKHEAVLALGASHMIDYSTEDFVEAIHRATGGRGADVILDIVGAAYLSRNLAALAPDGRLVIIGMQSGRRTELDIGALLGKRASVTATTLRSRPPEQKAAIVRGVRTQVWPLLTAGRIRPVIDQRLPLDLVGEAHRVVEASNHVGKVLLVVG
jgi:putative PIG3 family NAD(P)H quinone oxidoreductase